MKVIVKNARLGFADLFEPKQIGDNPDLKYSATLICSDQTKIVVEIDGEKKTLPHGQLAKVIERVVKEKFNGKIPPKSKHWAYNKADGSTERDEYVDKEGEYWAGFDAETYYISASKKADRCKGGIMKVLDQSKEAIDKISGRIFSGCYVNAIIDVYAFDSGNSKGSTASLEAVQLLKTGEALGFTEVDAENEFDMEEAEDFDDEGEGMEI